jgi:hypothetical protein
MTRKLNIATGVRQTFRKPDARNNEFKENKTPQTSLFILRKLLVH